METTCRWQILWLAAEVPLANAHRLIATCFEHVRDSRFIHVQTVFCLRSEHAWYAGAGGIPPGQQACSRRRAQRTRGVAGREPHTLCRETVNVGCWYLPAVTPEVPVPEVVEEDDDNIGRVYAGLKPAAPINANNSRREWCKPSRSDGVSVASSEASSRCRDRDSAESPGAVRVRNNATRSVPE